METSTEGCLQRKKNKKKNNKVEEFQLTKFVSLGSLASNDVRHRVVLEKKSHLTLSIVIKLPINELNKPRGLDGHDINGLKDKFLSGHDALCERKNDVRHRVVLEKKIPFDLEHCN